MEDSEEELFQHENIDLDLLNAPLQCSVPSDHDSSEEYIFQEAEHWAILLSNISQMKDSNILTDLTIYSEEKEKFQFHSLLLSAVSKPFREFFSFGDMEHFAGEIVFKGVKSEVLVFLENFIYRPNELASDTVSDWDGLMEFVAKYGIEGAVNCQGDRSSLVSSMQNMISSMTMTFLKILIGGQNSSNYYCHGIVLAACSPVLFERMAPKFIPVPHTEVKIPEVEDAEVMQQLLVFLYHAKIKITVDTVKGILSMACKLNLPAIKTACWSFITKRITPDNSPGTVQFAEIQGKLLQDDFFDKLQLVARDFIAANLHAVIVCEEFVQFTKFSDIVEYFCRGDISKIPQQEMLMAMLRWWKFDARQRIGHLYQLMSFICMLYDEEGFLEVFRKVMDVYGWEATAAGQKYMRSVLGFCSMVDEVKQQLEFNGSDY